MHEWLSLTDYVHTLLYIIEQYHQQEDMIDLLYKQ